MKLRQVLASLVLLTIMLLGAAGVHAALSTGLVDYWDADAPVSNNSNRVFNGTNLTVNGTPGTRAGILGNAYDAPNDDNNNYRYVPTLPEAPNGSQDRTLCAWHYLDTADGGSNQFVVQMGSTVGGTHLFGYFIGVSGSGNLVQFNYESDAPTTFSTSTTTWYFTCLSYTGGVTNVYINGQSRLNVTATLATSNKTLQIGQYYGHAAFGEFDGAVDEIGLWTRALNSSEVTQLYNTGTGMNYSAIAADGAGGGAGTAMNNLTIRVNDTRTNTAVTGFSWNYTTNNASDAGAKSGYCATTSCSITNFTGTVNVSVWNVSAGHYFNPYDSPRNSFAYANSTANITFNTFSNSIVMNLTNIVNGTQLTTFCGSAGTGVNGCTTNGSLVLWNVTGTQTLLWYNIEGSTYLNKSTTLTAYNSTSTNYSGNTSQGLLTLTAAQLYTLTSISSFNASNSNSFNSTTTGTLTMPANNGTQNLTVRVLGNYTMTTLCTLNQPLATDACAAVTFYDDLYNITAINITGSRISNFSVNATSSAGSTSTVWSVLNITTLPLIQGLNWTFTIDAPTFSIGNATLAANATAQTYQFNLSPTNSVYVYVYDQSTLAFLNSINTTITMTSGVYFYNQTRSTGSFLFQNITAGNYTVSVSTDGYAVSTYNIVVADRQTQTLNAYVAQSTVSVIFTNKDSVTGNVISGGTFTVQNLIGPNWVTVGQVTTDAFGQAVFSLLPLHSYQFIISADGYYPKTGIVNTVITSYTVLVNPNNTQSFTSYLDDFSYKLTPDQVSANSTTFSLTTNSPQGALQWFAIVVTWNGTTYSQNVTGSPSGGTASVTLDFTNVTGSSTVTAQYLAKSVNLADTFTLTRSWYLYGTFTSTNYTFVDFVDYYAGSSSPIDSTARGIMVTIVAVLVAAGIGLLVGAAPAMLAAALVFLLAGIFGWLGVGVTIVTVGSLIGLLIIGGRT